MYPNIIFAFLFIKIVTQGQLCQQLIRPNICTCFRFLAYKNCNAGAIVLAASQTGCTYMFCFSACKICSAGAAMPVTRAFLSKTSLAVFAFLIAKNAMRE